MKKILIRFIIFSLVHFLLTVASSFAAWSLHGKGTTDPLVLGILYSAYFLNFPIPVILRDNSIMLMGFNSILFGAAVVLCWIVVNKIKNKEC